MGIDSREKRIRQESRDKRPIASRLFPSCQSRGFRDLSKFNESKYPASRTFAIPLLSFRQIQFYDYYSHRDFNSFSNDKIFSISFLFFPFFFRFILSTKTRMLSSVYIFNASIILHAKRRSRSFSFPRSVSSRVDSPTLRLNKESPGGTGVYVIERKHME